MILAELRQENGWTDITCPISTRIYIQWEGYNCTNNGSFSEDYILVHTSDLSRVLDTCYLERNCKFATLPLGGTCSKLNILCSYVVDMGKNATMSCCLTI